MLSSISTVLLKEKLVEWWDRSYLSLKKHITPCWDLAKRHLNNSQTASCKTIWSDETKTELIGCNAQWHRWQHHFDWMFFFSFFSVEQTDRLVRKESKMRILWGKHFYLSKTVAQTLKVLEWPNKSLALNPVEHLWSAKRQENVK